MTTRTTAHRAAARAGRQQGRLHRDQEQRVYVEIANAQLAKLGLTPQQIADAVDAQNSVSGAGLFTTADDRVYVRPSGQLQEISSWRIR